MARHQPIDSTTPSGLVMLDFLDCNAPRSQNPGRATPWGCADSTRRSKSASQPASPSQALRGRQLRDGPPATPLPSPFFSYAHPPAVSPPTLPPAVSTTPPLALPTATPAYSPDAFAVPCRAIGPLEYGTGPFPDPDRPFRLLSQICSTLPPAQPDAAQLSPASQPAYRFVAVRCDQSTTEPPRTSTRTRTALPPQHDGSLTAGGRLGIHPPVLRYGSLWPCATLRRPPLSSGLATGSSKSLVPAQSRPGDENVFTPLIRGFPGGQREVSLRRNCQDRCTEVSVPSPPVCPLLLALSVFVRPSP